MARSNKSSNRTRRQPGGVSRRAKIVWGSLLVSMSVVYMGLKLMTPGAVAAAEGLSLTPLMNTTGADTLEAVFNTSKPTDRARWQAIVIHDSGSPAGSYATLDAQARANNLKGVGYHFVIGNGNGIDDGQVIIGRRWSDQAPGAHAAGSKADWFNRHSIGICLIGDGNRSRPTTAQMAALVKLTDALAREFKIPSDRVYLHSQIAPTDDPGRLFPDATFRAQLPKL